MEVSPDMTSRRLEGLETGVDYWVRVTASTRRGEGESTQIVTVTPVNNGTQWNMFIFYIDGS